MKQVFTPPEGCKIDSVEHEDNSVVIMFSKDNYKPKFKKGDFLISVYMWPYLFDYDVIIFNEEIPKYKGLCTALYNTQGPSLYGLVLKSFRPCNEKEKQKTLQYMHSKGLDFDEINYKVISYVWKPKDGEVYWYVDCNMNVLSRFYRKDSCLDSLNIESNNFFETKKLAQKYAEEFNKILKERKL